MELQTFCKLMSRLHEQMSYGNITHNKNTRLFKTQASCKFVFTEPWANQSKSLRAPCNKEQKNTTTTIIHRLDGGFVASMGQTG